MKLINKIELSILSLFLIVSIVLTFLSQKNYKRNLTEVEVTDPVSMNIEHNAEYSGKIYGKEDGGYAMTWSMQDYIDDLQKGDELTKVQMFKMNNIYTQNKKEQLLVTYKLGEPRDGFIDEVQNQSDGKKVLSYLKEMPEGWDLNDSYLVRLWFLGNKKSYVLPSKCVLKNDDKTAFIYRVEEKKKIWGTEYSLKKTMVNVIESNGEYTALQAAPGNRIVCNIDAKYDGMLVHYQVSSDENK